MISNAALHPRDLYLNRLAAFQDTEPVKIVTGIRRCGKSRLLDLMIQRLQNSGIPEENILKMNFESHRFDGMTRNEFYDYVMAKAASGRRTYLFFDEPQLIEGWEKTVNSLRVDLDCDIYITGSNAYLLSGEYATYLTGRYVEIRLYPLSFSEFLEFHGFSVQEVTDVFGKPKRLIRDQAGIQYQPEELFRSYLQFGGMPGLADTGLDQDKAMVLLDGVYTTVLMRDILQRDRISEEKRITDPNLLDRIARFLAYNVGNLSSYTNIAKTLYSSGLLAQSEKNVGHSVHTIQDYVAALRKAYLFDEAKRFDIKGKEVLNSQGKHYIADIGLRNYLLGTSMEDRGKVLENVVYLELLRRGFEVTVGKVGDREIDFRAVKAGEVTYIQVSESILDPTTRKRELKPLQDVQDNYSKMILSMDEDSINTMEGIQHRNIIGWLLEE